MRLANCGHPMARVLALTMVLGFVATTAMAQAQTYSGAASLRKPPSDLTQLAKQNAGTYPAEQVHQIIDGGDPVPGHGGDDMPLWGDAFSRSREGSSPEAVKARISALVRYLQTLQEKP